MLARSYGRGNRRRIFPLHTRHRLAILALVFLLAGTVLRTSGVLFPAAKPQVAPGSSLDLGKLPLAFEPNEGQTDPSVRFKAHVPGGAIFFMQREVVLSHAGPGGDQPAVNPDSAADAGGPRQHTSLAPVRREFGTSGADDR